MNTKRLLSFLAPVAVAILSLVGCSDYDNGFNEKSFSFKKDFVETFGEIDDDQDWNLAERANVNVYTSETKDIKVYAEENGSFTLLGNYRSVSGSQTLEFDISETASNIVVSNGDTALRAILGGYVSFDDLTSTDRAALDTRSHNVNRNQWPSEYVLPGNVTEDEIEKVVAEFSKPHYGAVNTITIPWEAMWVQQVYGGANDYLDGFLHEVNSLSQMNNLQVYNNNKGSGSGPTSNSGLEGYEHINDFNASSHYATYIGGTDSIIGTTLMWDLDPTGVPTEEVTIDGVTSNWVKQFAYHNAADSKYHAEYIMKVVNGKLYLGFDFYAHGTDVNPVSNKNMDVERDWIFNDWIIRVSKGFSAGGVSQSILKNAKPNSWILAAEDLGGTGDIDYNDVVVKVHHTAGNGYATVTPLAAGGTLASYLFFGDKCYGEIHQLLGAQPAVSGQYPVLNVGAASASGNSFSVQVGNNWSIACYSVTDWDVAEQGTTNMGGFSIRVLPKGTAAPASTPTSVNDPIFSSSEVSVVQSPTPGSAPYILCVPFSYVIANPTAGTKTSYPWAWPNESKYIVNAYNDFTGWVNDHTSNADWYTKPNSTYVYNTSAVGVPDALKPVEEEMTEEEINATQEAYQNIVVVQEYKVQAEPAGILKLKDGLTEIEVETGDDVDLLDYIDTNYPVYCTSSSPGDLYPVEDGSSVFHAENGGKTTEVTIRQLSIYHDSLKVNVVSKGSTGFYASYWDGSGNIDVRNQSFDIKQGEEFTFGTGWNHTNGTLTYSTDNDNITVTRNDKNFTVKAGSTIGAKSVLTVKMTPESNLYLSETFTVTFTITEKPKAVSNMSLTQTSVDVYKGVTFDLANFVNSHVQNTSGGSFSYSIKSGSGTINGTQFVSNTVGQNIINVKQAETDDTKEKTVELTINVKEKNNANLSISASSTSIEQGSSTNITANTSSNATITYTVSPSSAGTMSGNRFTASSSFTGTATITAAQAENEQYKAGNASVNVTVTEKQQNTGGGNGNGTQINRPSGISNDNNPAYRIQDIINAANGASSVVFTVTNSPYNYIEVVGTDANVNWDWAYKISTQNSQNHIVTGAWPSFTISTTVDVSTLQNMINNSKVYIVFTCSHSAFYVKPN